MTTRDQLSIAVEFIALQEEMVSDGKIKQCYRVLCVFFFVMLIITNFTFRRVRKIAKIDY